MTHSLPVARRSPSPPFPIVARFGLVVMAFGLVLDLAVHDLVQHVNEPLVVGFPPSEHAAHLVVLVGMVLVVVGIVRAGARVSRGPTQ